MPRHIAGTEYSKPINPVWLEIGQRVAQRRTELGLSQTALGALIRTPRKPNGITGPAIGLLEKGMSGLDMKNFDALARVLGVSREWLLTGSERDSELAKAIDGREFALLMAFRRQSEGAKDVILNLLQGGDGKLAAFGTQAKATAGAAAPKAKHPPPKGKHPPPGRAQARGVRRKSARQ